MKYSPTPWRKDIVANTVQQYPVVKAANWETIATLMTAAPDLFETLQMMQGLLVHIEGDIKGNKIKTSIIKNCPDVVEKMNKLNQVVWGLELALDHVKEAYECKL